MKKQVIIKNVIDSEGILDIESDKIFIEIKDSNKPILISKLLKSYNGKNIKLHIEIEL